MLQRDSIPEPPRRSFLRGSPLSGITWTFFFFFFSTPCRFPIHFVRGCWAALERILFQWPAQARPRIVRPLFIMSETHRRERERRKSIRTSSSFSSPLCTQRKASIGGGPPPCSCPSLYTPNMPRTTGEIFTRKKKRRRRRRVRGSIWRHRPPPDSISIHWEKEEDGRTPHPPPPHYFFTGPCSTNIDSPAGHE